MSEQKNSLFYIIGTFIIVVGLVVTYKKVNSYLTEKAHETRKMEISNGVHGLFKKCTDISTFDSRRECFKNQLIEMKKKNPLIHKEYVFEINNKIYDVKSLDEGDLIKITKPSNYGFIRCISNTFFFDWASESIYLSQENPLGGALCTTTNGGTVLIIPKDLSKDQIREIKNMFNQPIN